MVDLKSIKNPNIIKKYSADEINELAVLLREEILNQTSLYGGHLSSNLGAIEATIALCKVFDFDKDKILFDVGHQCYAYKILTGRSLNKLRQIDGISGFQKIGECPYDVFDAGHSSTAISVASGFALARDNAKEDYNIIVFIGDASLDNGVSYEGIRFLGKHNNKVIIILNDNTDKNKENIFNEKLFNSFNLDYIGEIDGHNINDICLALNEARKSNKSVLVHLRTIKGHGYKHSENDINNLYHGVSPFNLDNGKALKANNIFTFQDATLDSLDKYLSLDKKNILICPATMIGSNIYNLIEKHEDQFKDVGINEEHAFLYASGLALNGYRPIISVYSTFLQRGYDEIIHDLSRNNLGATILIDRAGLVGNDGETHQGIFDQSLLYNMPNTIISVPSRPSYIDSLVKLSFDQKGIFAIRYGKDKGEARKDNINLNMDSYFCLKTGQTKDIAILAIGPNGHEIKNMCDIQKIDVSIYDPLFVKPFNNKLLTLLADYKNLIIYDPTSIASGFALDLFYKLKTINNDINIKIMAIPNEHIKQASIKQQEELLNISPNDVIEEIKRL